MYVDARSVDDVVTHSEWVLGLLFLSPTRHKIGHFGDVFPSQSLGLVLKN